MSGEQGLSESIRLYTDQLTQVESALANVSDGTERESLLNLRSDLQELLQLTRETLDHEADDVESDDDGLDSTTNNNDGDVDDEYALFMSEINGLTTGSSEEPHQQTEADAAAEEPSEAADAALKDLVGSKCLAPHVHKWGSKSYHNALICSLEGGSSTNPEAEVAVKVLFINPTHQEMIPCKYFLEGDCKYSDEKCRFSHGEIVAFNELKDYREPRFELLRRKGGPVLSKHKTKRLWIRGTIKQADFEKKSCRIMVDEGKHEVECPFEDVLPLEGDETETSNTDSESDSDSEEPEDDAVSARQAQIIQRTLLNPAPSQRLGEWEKHTKGIGSKIMQKMGYVVGAGLGSRGEGIVVPVSAQVLPQGRSLDYCMQLREKANGDSNLFNVEKKLLRQKRIQEKRDSKHYAKAKEKEKKDVFNFLNNEVFGGSNGGGQTSKASAKKSNETQNRIDLPNCSSKNLNIASLKLSEQTRRLEMDIEKLTHSLSRHQAGSKMHTNLRKQITDKQKEISDIQKTEHSISREQQLRSDKRKMTVF